MTALAVVALAATGGWAAVVYSTAGSTYSQNFSSLSTSTNNPQTWTNDSTLTGWYLYSTAGGTPSTYTPQWETGISGSVFYHARNTGETNRSFLGARTGSSIGDASYGLQLTNNTGSQLNSFDLSFKASQFYKTTAAQKMKVFYSTDATSLTSGTWTEMTALQYTAIYTSGNAVVISAEEIASRADKSVTGVSVTWADGGDLWIKWTSYRDLSGDYSGASAVLAINDVTFSAIPEPGSVGMALVGGLALLARRLRRRG